jgi:hypothetical protein
MPNTEFRKYPGIHLNRDIFCSSSLFTYAFSFVTPVIVCLLSGNRYEKSNEKLYKFFALLRGFSGNVRRGISRP